MQGEAMAGNLDTEKIVGRHMARSFPAFRLP
jgi:hypothetical protein